MYLCSGFRMFPLWWKSSWSDIVIAICMVSYNFSSHYHLLMRLELSPILHCANDLLDELTSVGDIGKEKLC